MGNVPWDGTGINCYGDGNGTEKYVPWTTLAVGQYGPPYVSGDLQIEIKTPPTSTEFTAS